MSRKMTYEDLEDALLVNLRNMGYEDIASLYNESCVLAFHNKPVDVVYESDDADEPVFIERDSL